MSDYEDFDDVEHGWSERKPWVREEPDELSEDEKMDMQLPGYTEASDLEICRQADLGDPVADTIFHSWPEERRNAAIRSADANPGESP